ncbi:TPA: transketolase [Candidatus Uhrbacteria bacterium]|nr:transketolase [Candidatus Uhrbacteria bacterium]HCB55732.1 transketolase [Candidatus Uhrbacteria bacterium]
MFLARNVLDPDTIKREPTRNGYGEGSVEAGKRNKNIVMLCCDLTDSTRSVVFKQAFPDRYIQMGVSEQSMASIASGLALAGKIPFISSYASFSPGRNWEQLRTSAALQGANIKIAGAHAGVSVGPDGATHQMTEDIALMRVLPNMDLVVPCDSIETKKATIAIAQRNNPGYIRFAREKTPVFTTEKTPFKLGRAETYRFGEDVTIFGAGPILYEALIAADVLSQEYGIEVRVINLHTLKPLDVKTIVTAAKETGAIVTCEEAQVIGGLGGAVCETLAMTVPVPVERIGMQECFGTSGNSEIVFDAMGLTAPFIAMAVIRALNRKYGEKVPVIPEYITAAEEKFALLKKEINDEALSRTPKKWGGKKEDKTLKSRQ